MVILPNKLINKAVYVVTARNISGIAVCEIAPDSHVVFFGLRRKFGSQPFIASEHYQDHVGECHSRCGWGFAWPLARLPEAFPGALTLDLHNEALLTWLIELERKYS